MRLYFIVLTIIVCCSKFASAEIGNSPFRNVVETDSSTKLDNRALFRPDSGLTVELDTAFLMRCLGDSPQAAELADQIVDLRQLAEATNTSLAKLKDLSGTTDSANRTKIYGTILPLFDQVIHILEKRYPDEVTKLDENLILSNASLEQDLNLIFRTASEIADRSDIAINQLLPKVNVRLQLSRDPDFSRQPSQPFGVLPSDSVANKAEELQKAIGGDAAASPQALADGIKKQFLNAATAQYNALLKKADTLVKEYENKSTIVFNAIGNDNEKIKKINTDITELKRSYDNLVTAIKAVTEADSSLPLADLVSRASLVLPLAQNFIKLLEKVNDGLSDAKIFKDALNANKPILDLLSELKTSAEAFGDEAWQSAVTTLNATLELLNLRAKLQQIGETLQEAKGGKVQFDNNDGSLGNMPKMLSYDEIRISVVQMTDPAKPVQVGPPFYLIAWQPHRWDNITALGYYRKSNNKWAAAPILGQVYKYYDGRKYSDARIYPGIGYSIISLDQNDDSQAAQSTPEQHPGKRWDNAPRFRKMGLHQPEEHRR